ncbi:PP2C-like domain-containing protein CG9801 isoform X2 [Anoplophora glabripennis]|uniref:PP2C-like domain-containing protein CG9801 isoform X2 n=1 Tax=Anoplophora glabripennis TaxID=217634 RepID=UPI0008758BE3|nr:PP2C-like domain-containing protein CG9801 isoform X2 [Anoplophora glabripennis]
MPSLRKRVSSYFRQLSFHNESRDKKHNINENTFVTKYLQGIITLCEGPPIIYGKNPTDLPNYDLGHYENGPNTIIGCYSGPNGGLTTVKRIEKHLCLPDADIDFIDTHDEEPGEEVVENSNIPLREVEDSSLPTEWNKKSELIYGLSDSLYDRNQVTRNKNGDPIADCFGIIARRDSAILAVADGVNWGEKASIAAKSAVHGSLHYLNKTIFNDTKPFENLTIKTDESSLSSSIVDENVNLISNTREVFICLLRAFNCAHDLILENKGMLTTLTVAVVLPLKQKLERRVLSQTGSGERRESETQYVCCVCNVGDTLAYVYSQQYGVRELTKGSHDINCNRDMRDALGALGPVDGINPELSNLTLSITTLRKGDIVMVASDGLTDNFDPNVCRFTVNCNVEPSKPKRTSTSRPAKSTPSHTADEHKPHATKPVKIVENPQKPPIKPPRRSKNRDDSSRSSAESSVKSNTMSEKSSSQSIESVTEVQNVDNKSQSDNVSSELINTDKLVEGSISNIEQGSSDEKALQEPEETSTSEVHEATGNKPEVDYANPLVQQFIRANSVEDTPKVGKSVKKPTVVENKASSLRRQATSQQRQEIPQSSQKPVKQRSSVSKTLQTVDDTSSASKKQEVGYKFLRSKTSLDIRSSNLKQILRNEDGIPYITPIQRYELQLLLMEDVLKHGISGKDCPCTSARKLCENLISFTISITSAKRHTLEDQDLYFDNKNGVLVEVSSQEKKIRRKKGLERVQNLPGKLDHVTVAAYNVGNFAH